MILDTLDKASLYFDIVPRFKEFMLFYQANDLSTMPAGSVILEQDNLIVQVLDFKGKEEKDCLLEAHRNYIDIHIPMNTEKMGWKALRDCQHILREYDSNKDIAFYSDSPTTSIMVPKGSFAVFFPSDVHQPGIAPAAQYRKIIVKTRVINQ